MDQGGTVFVDHVSSYVYYLGRDLLLMRAPVRGDVAFGGEGRAVRASHDLTHSARQAAIRAALLGEVAGPDAQWLPHISGEAALARAFADRAGVPEPSLTDGRFVQVESMAEMELPMAPSANTPTD